jgi:solute carrier family 25 aspartate/glutamate transporter 12/13
MKGLQGERLRQAFKYLDTNLDGFILPDQFKRIILVCRTSLVHNNIEQIIPPLRNLQDISYLMV